MKIQTSDTRKASRIELDRLLTSYLNEIDAYSAPAVIRAFSIATNAADHTAHQRQIQEIAGYLRLSILRFEHSGLTIEPPLRKTMANVLRIASDYAGDLYNEPLSTVVIEEFERAGGLDDLQAIEHCMARMPKGESLWTRAAIAVENMHERLQTDAQSRILLRPAYASQSAELLRPAGPPSEGDPYLLRPADPGTESA